MSVEKETNEKVNEVNIELKRIKKEFEDRMKNRKSTYSSTQNELIALVMY